jgi:hypothetical protein
MKPTLNLKNPKHIVCTVSLDIDAMIKAMNARQLLSIDIATNDISPVDPLIIGYEDYESPLDAMEAESISVDYFDSKTALRGYSAYVIAHSLVKQILARVEDTYTRMVIGRETPVFVELGFIATSSIFIETANEIIFDDTENNSERHIYFTAEARHNLSKPLTSLVCDDGYHIETIPKYMPTGAMQFDLETNSPMLLEVTSSLNNTATLYNRYNGTYRLTSVTNDD